MKVPKPRKLPSGTWFIQLRLGGESISVTDASERGCIKEAQAIKAEYLAGKRAPKPAEPEGKGSVTLTQAIDHYITARSNKLSPSTIRGYRVMQRNRFKSVMDRPIADIKDEEWERLVNEEAACCSPKTLRNTYAFLHSVILDATKHNIPKVKMPGAIVKNYYFLDADQIKVFVAAVKDTPYAIPLLLALSSMRISEITALRWEAIPQNPKFIRVQGAVVQDEHNKYTQKAQNKNAASSRLVPVLIPELSAAIERDRKPEGPVLDIAQNTLRKALARICEENGLPPVTVHGLRHSFASLAYHLQIPEKIVMEIGGWADFGTMRRIYTHIATSDITRYQDTMGAFYSGENANKNAN